MDQYKQEKLLAIFYPLVIVFGLISTISTVIAWNHWKYVLDTCVNEINCGCILKGASTITYFIGGHIAYCHWAAFGLLVSIFIAIIFGCYHVYRVCISSGKNRIGTHTVKQRSGDIILMTTRSEITDNDVSPYYWIPATIASGIMVLYTLVHAAMFLDGFLQTCNQYRNELIKYTHATGQMVAAIQGRITCATVYDFMDYIHQDVSYDRRRVDRINTSASLILSLIAVWCGVVLWISIFIINVMQSRRSRVVRV